MNLNPEILMQATRSVNFNNFYLQQTSFVECHSSNQNPIYYDHTLSDINNVGLPLQEDIVQPLR